MKRLVWYCFWSLQALGLACLSGGESFAVTRIGFIARIVAVIILEPGFIIMQTAFEYFLFPTAFTPAQQFWFGSVSAVAFNALFLLLLIFFIGNIRPPRKN